DPLIVFDQNGLCNYCLYYKKSHEISKGMVENNHFEKTIAKIKREKRGKYDCLLGISAGTDSSYVAHLLKKNGLNVLLLHCDNGWDTDLAVSNLNKIKNATGFDLEIRKMDSQAFYSVQ